MNTTLIFLMPLIMALSNGNPIIDKENCTCNGIKLYGDVKVVKEHADLKVRINEGFPNLQVQEVSWPPYNCGEWRFVDSYQNFTIKYVENATDFPDIDIKFVNAFPGMQ